jgi:ABC-type uncharacterized transport system permease subunit
MEINKSIFIPLLLLVFLAFKNDDNIFADDNNEALFGQWEYKVIMSDTADKESFS